MSSLSAALNRTHWPLALGTWALGWLAMAGLESHVDLANLSMVLVLTSALATLWLPMAASGALTTAAVLAFNWFFVPPRFAFNVDLRQDALLLLAMLAVGWIIAALMDRQRQLAERARRSTEQVQRLQQLAEALRASAEPAQQVATLQQALATLLGQQPRLLVLQGDLPPTDDAAAALLLGAPSSHELTGLWHCLRMGQAFGPGTGRHEDLPEWYWPLRAQHAPLGAAMIRFDALSAPADDALAQAQALCDQAGLALQRAQSQRQADRARDQAQLQQVRNALLAAISHDFRTPLATILGSATSLRDQDQRLSAEQRTRLLARIADEAEQLARMADNTLQLARLDAPGVTLTLDWQSAEELVGAVMARARGRDPQQRLRARVEPDLPLVRCDALLMTQLLDNLIQNALTHGGPTTPVELLVRRLQGHVVFAVRDRGPGVDPAWRERIFEVFQRGQPRADGDADAAGTAPSARSAGVGLAVCRAIAQAHGGTLKLRARSHGGASFECWLPEQPVPEARPAAHAETAA